MPTLPTNPHYVGDSGHVNDHNTIVSALSDFQTQINGKASSVAFGSWTPGLSNSGGTPSFSTKTGYYAKIDSLYVCWFVIDGGTLTANGTAYVTGLPANISSSVPANADCGSISTNTPAGSNNYILKRTSGNDTKIAIYLGGQPFTSSNITFAGGFLLYKAA